MSGSGALAAGMVAGVAVPVGVAVKKSCQCDATACTDERAEVSDD